MPSEHESVSGETLLELEEQAGFPDASRADQHHRLPAPSDGLCPSTPQQSHLPLAAYEDGETAFQREIETRPPLSPALDAKDGDWMRFAFHLPTAAGDALEVGLNQGVGRVAYQQGVGISQALQPRSEVGGVPHRGIVHPQVIADATDDYWARVDPDAYVEGDAV